MHTSLEHFLNSCLILVAIAVIPGCGENDTTEPTPICTSVTPPEEMQDCLFTPDPTAITSPRDMKQFCQNQCYVTLGIAIDGTTHDPDLLTPLQNIREIQGGLRLETAHGINDLTGLGSVEQVGTKWKEGVDIETNNHLESLEGLDSLTYVGGRVQIFDNNELAKLDGFPKLERIDGPLVVQSNNAMTDITGLENLEYVDGPVKFDTNPNLPRCRIEQFVDGIDTITGDVTIEGNGTGTCQ